jgi:hypothetical protein
VNVGRKHLLGIIREELALAIRENHDTLGFSGVPEDSEHSKGVDQNFSPKKLEGLNNKVFLREAADEDPPTLVDDEPEREPIVVQIKNKMKDVGISGKTGMFSQVGDVDEFEDLIRFIFDDVELDNRHLASVALRISKDFLDDPDSAASLSTFNLDE